MPKVLLVGWRPGLKVIQLVKLIRSRTGLSLREAKISVDLLTRGDVITLNLDSLEDAQSLSYEATELGAITEVRMDP